MEYKLRQQLTSLIACALLTPLASAQQAQSPSPSMNLDAMLRQQAAQTCANIRQGLLSVAGTGQRNSEIEASTGERFRLSEDAQRGIINDFPRGLEDPDMRAVMENVIERYQRTGRTEDLRRSAMNDDIFMVPCTEIQLRKFKAMTQRFTDPQQLGRSQGAGPAEGARNPPSMQTQQEYDSPSYQSAPAPTRNSGQSERRQLPRHDYGTGRR